MGRNRVAYCAAAPGAADQSETKHHCAASLISDKDA